MISVSPEFVVAGHVFVLNVEEELQNHNNQRRPGSALSEGLVCLTNRIVYLPHVSARMSHSSLSPWKRYANGNQLVAQLHLSGRGGVWVEVIVHPTPPFTRMKHVEKSAGVRLALQQGADCCWINWSCVLAPPMENLHVRVDCLSPDAWGPLEAGHELFWATLTFVTVLTFCWPHSFVFKY